MSDPHRWLLNTRTGTLHDRHHLDERCNTDDIEYRYRFLSPDRDEAMQHLAFRRACSYCHPRNKRSARHPRLTTVANPDAPAPA